MDISQTLIENLKKKNGVVYNRLNRIKSKTKVMNSFNKQNEIKSNLFRKKIQIEQFISNKLKNRNQINRFKKKARKNFNLINKSKNLNKNLNKFSDEDFKFYYGEQNLYDNDDFFDNKKYRIFVSRDGDNLRVFKPISIIKESNFLLCKILGVYCNNINYLNQYDDLDEDFIWPLSQNRHEENVNTIRKLISKYPVPDKLPFVNLDLSCIPSQPYALNLIKEKKISKNSNSLDIYLDFEQNEESSDHDISKNLLIDSSNENYELDTNKFQINNKSTNKLNSSKDSAEEKEKKKNLYFKGIQPAHCPYCEQLFSATFNAKLHFNGRYKGSGKHISCKVRNKVGDKNLDSVICGENCSICNKM